MVETRVEIVVRVRVSAGARSETTEETVVQGEALRGAVVDGKMDVMAPMTLDDARTVMKRIAAHKGFVDVSWEALRHSH